MAVIKKIFFSHKSQVNRGKFQKMAKTFDYKQWSGVGWGGVDGGGWNEGKWEWSGEKKSGVR